MGISGIDEDRLRPYDWRDKYRWPDPDQGWSGPLAGYPPDHPIRAGRPIPLHLIAKRYQQDEQVTRYQAMGLIGSHIPGKESPWTAPAGGDTESGAMINTPAEKAKGADVTVTGVTESPVLVTAVTEKRGRKPIGDRAMTAAEKQRVHRARMRAKKLARQE